jgi:hypothetical protein
MVAALGIAGVSDPPPDCDIRVREIAQQISNEFRTDLPLPDAIHDLIVRGVIDPGLELFRAA